MTKINGWKRIGIIASIAWVLGGAWYSFQTTDKGNDVFIQEIVAQEDQCRNGASPDSVAQAANDAMYAKCIKNGDDELAMLSSPSAMSARRQEAAIVAFGPVPLAWGFVYLVIFLAGWVKRGFQRSRS